MQKVGILFLKFVLSFVLITTTYPQTFDLYKAEKKSFKELSSTELLEKAKFYYSKGNYYNAIQYLSEYLERVPEDLENSLFLAKNYIFINNCSRAIPILDKFSNNFPEIRKIEIFRNFCLLKEGKIQEVQQNILELEKELIDEPEFWLLKGEFYLKLNQYDLVNLFYKKYLLKFPEEYQIYLKLIEFELNKKNFLNAKSLIGNFKNQFPDNILYYKLLGDYHYKIALEQKQNPIENFSYSYLNYKTYLNYIPFDQNIFDLLLSIAYTLQDMEKIKDLLKEYNFTPKNLLLTTNIYQILEDHKLSDALEKLCKENKIFLSCIRYDFYLLKTQSKKKIERTKNYIEFIKSLKKNLKPYYIPLLWVEQFSENQEIILKEFLEYYKNSLLYEDYYLTLLKLKKATNDPKYTILIEKFQKDKDKYIPFEIFSTYPLSLIKNAYRRDKKNILVLNPFPLEEKEYHFRESDLLRNYIEFFINQIPYFRSIESKDLEEIKIRYLNTSRYYLFYDPELIEIIQEWEKDTNKKIDYIIESEYRIINNYFFLNLVIRNSFGEILGKKSFSYSNQSEFSFIFDLENFLLTTIPIEGKFLADYNNKILINAGLVDKIKKDQVFKFDSNYYKVEQIFPYTSLISLIKGKPMNYNQESVFIRVSSGY